MSESDNESMFFLFRNDNFNVKKFVVEAKESLKKIKSLNMHLHFKEQSKVILPNISGIERNINLVEKASTLEDVFALLQQILDEIVHIKTALKHEEQQHRNEENYQAEVKEADEEEIEKENLQKERENDEEKKKEAEKEVEEGILKHKEEEQKESMETEEQGGSLEQDFAEELVEELEKIGKGITSLRKQIEDKIEQSVESKDKEEHKQPRSKSKM